MFGLPWWLWDGDDGEPDAPAVPYWVASLRSGINSAQAYALGLNESAATRSGLNESQEYGSDG